VSAITTTVYKYNRYANWMLILYCLATLGLFIFSAGLSSTGVIIYCVLLFGLPVYVGMNPKSFLSVRRVDDRALTISNGSIRFGESLFDIRILNNLSIFIFAFDNFAHEQVGPNGRTSRCLESGDKNTISFSYLDDEYAFTFFLANYDQYKELYTIIADWQKNLIPVKARSAFDAGYIAEQIGRYGLV
jgi:hypothetical protein